MQEKLRFYNDYYQLTKRYLRNLNKFKTALSNLESKANNLAETMEGYEDVAAPIATYGESTHGVHRPLNGIEAAAERHIELKDDWHYLNADRKQLETIIQNVENAVAALPAEDQDIIKDYVVNGLNILVVAEKYHYSDRTIRNRTKKAIFDVALMIFGIKAQPTHLSFVFAK